MNLNLNTEQLGIFDDCIKRPVIIGLAYNRTIAAGGTDSWTYTAPPGASVIITDLVGQYAAGELAVTIKDGATDTYMTTLSQTANAVPFSSVFRGGSSQNLLQYPIVLQPNGQLIINVNNTGGTNSTNVYATAMGVMCLT